MQRIFLINLLWQKALSCQAFPAKKKISDKKYDIFSIIFWSSQPTSGIASGILKTKHRTNTERSPPAMPCFSAAQRLRLRNVPPPRKQLRNTKTACRTFSSADGLQLRQQESNLRWGSQSPLPYRLAMAHHAKQYSIFSAVPQEVRRIFAAFSVRCLPHLRRFGSVFGLCGRDPAFSIFFHVFTKGKFCGMRFSKNTVRRGHKIHIAKVKFIFFLIFLIIFSKDCIFCCDSGTLDVIKIS